jgi:predicted transcriptional regulator
MKISEIVDTTAGSLVCSNGKNDKEVFYAFTSDLMSDVLTLLDEHLLLITGLVNTQSIRTASMSDIHIILFIRGKKPTKQMVELAKEQEIVLITSPYSAFKASALLYEKGLLPVY